MADLRYPVSIAGRGFLVSRKGGRFARRSIPLQKAQQDTSDAQGEQSLNPEDLWRRSFESWHRGAGQPSFDRAGGDPFRFDNSLGVDPWEQWQLGLHPDTERKLASTATGVRLVVAGNYLYCADGQTLRFTQNIPASGLAAWTTVTGTPAAPITGIVSDGYRVWTAHGSYGIYSTVRGTAATTHYSVLPASTVGFAKGRLMIGSGRVVTNPTAETYPTGADVEGGGVGSGGVMTDGQTLNIGIGWSDISPDNVIHVVILSWTGTGVLGRPAGYSLLALTQVGNVQSQVFFKFITGPGTVTASATGDIAGWSYVSFQIRDVDRDNPFDVHAVSTSAIATSSIVTPTVTTTRSNSVVLTGYAAIAPAALTQTPPPGTFTGFTSGDISRSTTSPVVHTGAGDRLFVAPGATGTFTWTLSGNADAHVAWTIPIRTVAAAPLFTHANPDFQWVGFAEGQGDIYAAGFSGDKSLVYRTAVKADGTALDAPVVASALPDGEIVRSIYGYLGLIFIGTDNGLRMATSDANGDLTIGALIETPAPVRCFEGQGQYVWFGYEDFDVSPWAAGTYDGLGRLDLTQQTSPLVPAYASDLMVPASTGTTEQVQSIVTFGDRRVFSIADEGGVSRGVYAATDQKVATGYLDSGLITYGIADTKVATYLDVRSRPLVGTLEAYLSTDSGAFTTIGTSTTPGSTRTADPLNAGPSRGDTHEVRVRLNRAAVADAVGPTVTRLTLRSEPAPSRGRIYQVPLILSSKLNVANHEVSADPAEALAFIEGLFDTQTLVAYREGATTVQVFVKDYEFVVEHQSADRKSEQGICVVTLKAPGS